LGHEIRLIVPLLDPNVVRDIPEPRLWVPETRPGPLTCTFARAAGIASWHSGTARFTRIAVVHTLGSALRTCLTTESRTEPFRDIPAVAKGWLVTA
jgi:hypothetical protein